MRRDNKPGPAKKIHQHLVGNHHAKKPFPRNSYLHVRFNDFLLELGKQEAARLGISHSDWVERAYRKALRDAGRLGGGNAKSV